MTITCENCNTRFVLDEARIPAQGARVRCSRCQHRFQVKPPPAQPSPAEIVERAVEHSAPFEAGSGREPPPEPAAHAQEPDGGDGALDNPEFLFDEPGASSGALVPPPVEQEPAEDPREQTFSRQGLEERREPPQELVRTPVPEAPPAALSAPAPAPVDVSSAPAAEAQPVAEEDPGGAEASGLREDLFGASPDEELSIASAEDAPPLDLASLPPRTAAGIRGATGATLSAGGPVRDVAPGPESAARPWRGFAREVVPAAEAETEAPNTERRRSVEGAGSARARVSWLVSFATRVAASVVVAALVAGAVRVLVQDGVRSGSASVRVEGWLATDLDAFHARSADGRRVLVIRGALVAEGAQPPPAVRALLLDVDGKSVGAPTAALPVRLDGAELAPSALAARLASEPAQPAGPVRGFTILIAEPPATARRYRVELAASDR